jgi:signal transduction histidine kinase
VEPVTDPLPNAGRGGALTLAARAMSLAALVGAAGNAIQFASGGAPILGLAAAAGACSAAAQLWLLRALDRRRPWAGGALFGVVAGSISALALVETEVGSLLYLTFGTAYLATLSFVITDRPRPLQVGASALFPALLVLRHLVRPYGSLEDPVELAGCAVAGAVGALGVSTWVQRVFGEYADALERSRSVQHDLAALNAELARARDAALEGSRAKDRFLANMSHELRTPLNAIVGFTDLLVEDPDVGRDQLIQDLGAIRSASTHLLALVSAVLDVARIESGAVDVRLEAFDLRAVLDEVAITGAALASARGNAFRLEADLDRPGLVSDPTKLRQILLNLLGNAARFTERGQIVLAVRSDEGGLRAEVRDTGVGIPADHLDRVFERFVQLDPSSTRVHGGTGLGLAVARGLAVALGGSLVAESEVGRGSTFRLTLPRG